MATTRRPRRSSSQTGKLTLDQALIALFIGAMNANQHVAADEAARAHHLIWSTRRFRRRSGEVVNKLIQEMRRLVETTDAKAVVAQAAEAIPARLRPAAFAVVADLLLADGTLEAPERRFLRGLGAELALPPETTRHIVDAVIIKNQL